MLPFIMARLMLSVPLVIGATIVVFLIMRLIPGDPALIYSGPDAPAEAVEVVRERMGLNEPLPVQYLIWVGQVVRGDLGDSYLSRLPVTELLAQRIPATLELTAAGMLVIVLVAIPAGVVAAITAGSKVDWFVTSMAGLSIAIPGFWLGILAIILFAQVLGWLPPGGRGDWGADPIDAAKHLFLPAVVLASGPAATLTRLVRSAMLEALYEDYVRTARSKGLSESKVVLRHVLRNAMVPVVTVISLQVGFLLGGAVIIESVFAWPGVGRLILSGLANRDYTVVQGALLSLVFVYIFVNLVTDISYGFLDPRIRVGGSAER
jgi:ABC-type dipeptide/oligopeptide/nickel transport system permease component